MFLKDLKVQPVRLWEFLPALKSLIQLVFLILLAFRIHRGVKAKGFPLLLAAGRSRAKTQANMSIVLAMPALLLISIARSHSTCEFVFPSHPLSGQTLSKSSISLSLSQQCVGEVRADETTSISLLG